MILADEMREVEAVEPESRIVPETTEPAENLPREEESTRKNALKYGPLALRNSRSSSNPQTNQNSRSTIQNLDSEDELDSSSDDESKKQSSTQVAYTPLELDSDVESDLSSVGPRSRRRIPSKDYDQPRDENDRPSSRNTSLKRRFPNPDHYEDPRRGRNSRRKSGYQNDSLKTSGSKFAKRGQESDMPKQGDFNEVGIPIVDPFPDGKGNSGSTNTAHLKDVKSLIDRYEQTASQETLDEDRLSVKSEDTRSRSENKIGIPMIAMVPGRSSSRGQSSSGFGSLPDVQDKNPPDSHSERFGTPSPKSVAKGGKATHQTDL